MCVIVTLRAIPPNKLQHVCNVRIAGGVEPVWQMDLHLFLRLSLTSVLTFWVFKSNPLVLRALGSLGVTPKSTRLSGQGCTRRAQVAPKGAELVRSKPWYLGEGRHFHVWFT